MLVGIEFLGMLTATTAIFFLKINDSTCYKIQTIEYVNNIHKTLIALKKIESYIFKDFMY